MLFPYRKREPDAYHGLLSKKRLLPKIMATVVFISVLTLLNFSYKAAQGMRGLQETLCAHGALRSRLGDSGRILCSVESDLADVNYEDAFGVTQEHTREADYTTERPGGANNLAFVVTIPSCPQDTTHPAAEDDPGAAFYDAVGVLRDSICNCTARNPDSGSQYDSTMYAVIHPDAVFCNGFPPGGAAQGRRNLMDGNYTYDRVKVLEELGFWVVIWGEPVSQSYKTIQRRLYSNLLTWNFLYFTVALLIIGICVRDLRFNWS